MTTLYRKLFGDVDAPVTRDFICPTCKREVIEKELEQCDYCTDHNENVPGICFACRDHHDTMGASYHDEVWAEALEEGDKDPWRFGWKGRLHA